MMPQTAVVPKISHINGVLFCLLPGAYIRVMSMIELYSWVLYFIFPWYTWHRGPILYSYLFWVERVILGFQVLDWAVLSLSARIDDEDDVPLVILYNGPHLLYTSHLSLGECEYGFWLSWILGGLLTCHGIWHFTIINHAMNSWSSAEQGEMMWLCSISRLRYSIAGIGVCPTGNWD